MSVNSTNFGKFLEKNCLFIVILTLKEEEDDSHPKSCSFNIGGSNGEMTSIF